LEEIKIVFEDKAIIVLSKPHGVASQSIAGESLTTMYPDYHFITRLDQPAAGLILMTKSEIASMNMTKLLNTGGIEKSYLCLVEGLVPEDSGQVSHLLIKNGAKSYINEKGKQSDLSYKVHKRLDKYTFLNVEIKQGRFHQIRCQLAQIGYPIKGDLKYGSKRSNKEGGIYLCCNKISFEHPLSGEVIDLILNPSEFHLPLWKLA